MVIGRVRPGDRSSHGFWFIVPVDDHPGRSVHTSPLAPGCGVRAAPVMSGLSGVPAVASAELFRILGHPVRVQMLDELARGPRSLRELQTQVAGGGPRLGPQLTALRRAGLGAPYRRRGRVVEYGLVDPDVVGLLADVRELLSRRLRAHRALLGELAAETVPGRHHRPPGRSETDARGTGVSRCRPEHPRSAHPSTCPASGSSSGRDVVDAIVPASPTPTRPATGAGRR